MEDRNLVLAEFYRELHEVCENESQSDLEDLVYRMRSYRDKEIDDAVDSILDELTL